MMPASRATAERGGRPAEGPDRGGENAEGGAVELHWRQPETAEELHWSKAKIFETRAHNRFEGHADEIARLDLEDALKIYHELLGSDHEETLRLKELLDQVSGNY